MKRKLICLLCLLMSASVWATDEPEKQKAYRWIGDDGSLVFSSSPPPAGVKAEEVELRDADTILHQERKPSSRRVYDGGSAIDKRANKRSGLKDKIHRLEERLERARRQYEEGEEPLEGERIGSRNGSRLSEAYFERRDREAASIKSMETQLDQLWKEHNELR
ncbi:DUF4124 domain-containing protein [Pseudomonadota bacterium]